MSAYRNPTNGRFIARDGLANLVSGAGTTADKRTAGFYVQPYILPEQIEAAYRSSWMMRKGIDTPPFDMTRMGRDWQMEEANVDKVEAEEKRLGVWTRLREALILGRLGGGLIVMGTGADPTQPIADSEKKAGGLSYLHVMNRWQVTLGQIVRDPTDPLFGQPAYFQINFGAGTKAGNVKIHPSRVIAFRGKQVPHLWGGRGDDWYWGDPLFVSVQDAVKNADAAMNGFASLIEEAKLDSVSIPGLTEYLRTTDGENLIRQRVTVANQLKSSFNTRILDGGKAGVAGSAETWETRQVTWAGMPDVIRVYASIVAGAFDIPATRFLGKAPDGMNATGSGDEANYIAKIRADQDAYLRPALDQLDAVLLPSAGVAVTAEANYDFPPLQELSELDKATAFNTRMTGLVALEGMQVIPDIAWQKAMQHTAVEEGWLAGLDGALAELPEDERFPSLAAPVAGDEPTDPSALQEGGDPQSRRAPVQPMEAVARRRAANDALKSAGIDPDARKAILDALEGEQSRPFGDGDVSGEPRDEHGRWTNGAAHRFIKHALSSGQAGRGHVLGEVEAELASKAQALGHDLAGKTVTLDHSYTRHIIASHGDERERLRGQLPITHGDLAAANDILNAAHSVKPGDPATGRYGHARIEATTHFAGRTYTTVAEVRKRTAMIVSMWKR